MAKSGMHILELLVVIASVFVVTFAGPHIRNVLPPREWSLYGPPKEPSGLYVTPDESNGDNVTIPITTTQSTTPITTTQSTTPSKPIITYTPVITKTPPPGGKMLMPYDFSFGVDDPDSGNKYSHSETSDGEYVVGEYSVLLPDGRTQLVRFSSSPETGYKANVTYLYLK